MLSKFNPKSTWRINLLSLGLVSFASFLTSLTQGRDRDRGTTLLDAVTLMKVAHDGRANWRQFPGFRADIKVAADGQSTEEKLFVSPSGDIKVELSESNRFAWVNSSLKSIVGHRLSADDAIQTVAFADDQESHPMGRLLKSTDDSDKSMWRV